MSYSLGVDETMAEAGGGRLRHCGEGVHIIYHFLQPGLIAIHDDRSFIPSWEVNGGAPARTVLEKSDGTRAVVGNKREDLPMEAGDMLHFITWGGGDQTGLPAPKPPFWAASPSLLVAE